MWRRSSISLSSRLISQSNPNLNPNSNPSIYRSSLALRSTAISLLHGGASQTHLHSSTVGFPSSSFAGLKSEGGRALRLASSATLLEPSSVVEAASVSKVRDVAEAVRHYGQCYWELSKAKLSMLVVATSGAGFVLGSGGAIDVAGLCLTCTGTMMVAASANSLNQVFEKSNDAKMKRTSKRPLPSGRLSVQHAAIWASSVGVAGTTLLACKANMLTAGLAASTLGLYAFVYTPLKQIHPVNTWVGAVVGAIPPLLGWTAACGQLSLNGMILPAALYFWQIPHFMALAYLCRSDYAAGGFRMLSLYDASGRRTSSVALRNCLYLLPLGFLAYDWGMTSGWFCLESTLLTLSITAGAVSFYRDPTAKTARRMFHASLLYLPVFMSGMMLHRLTTDNQQDLTVTNPDKLAQSLSLEPQEHEIKENRIQIKRRRDLGRPPVAYASVAPFPFLPAPVYADSDCL